LFNKDKIFISDYQIILIKKFSKAKIRTLIAQLRQVVMSKVVVALNLKLDYSIHQAYPYSLMSTLPSTNSGTMENLE